VKVRDLIMRLNQLVNEHPEAADMEALSEGCDCYGECVAVFIITKGWTEPSVLLAREEPAK